MTNRKWLFYLRRWSILVLRTVACGIPFAIGNFLFWVGDVLISFAYWASSILPEPYQEDAEK